MGTALGTPSKREEPKGALRQEGGRDPGEAIARMAGSQQGMRE